MALLESLGIDIKLLIAQIINFGILLVILKKFLYKPIIEKIEKDEKVLKEAQLQKKNLEQQRAEFEKRKQEELKKAQEEAKQIINDAQLIAKEIKNKALRETSQEKQKVIEQIKYQLSETENEKNKKR